MIFVPFSWSSPDETGIIVTCGSNGNKTFCMMTAPYGESSSAILYDLDSTITDYDYLPEDERHYLWTESGLVELTDGLNLEEGYMAENISGYDNFNDALREYM